MSTQVSDYSTLTDAELNFEIAKRLGDGDEYENVEHYARLADLLYAPSFATDANAALELFKHDPIFALYPIHLDGDEYEWVAERAHRNDLGDTFTNMNFADNPARATCLCWLRLQDAKNVSDTH